MLRPVSAREAVRRRPATTTDIIGVEATLRAADELREERERFDHAEEDRDESDRLIFADY
jgi:hypothetical protein